jgi:hypothetical protein
MTTVERGCDLSNPGDGCMRSDNSEGDTPLQIKMRELYYKVIKLNFNSICSYNIERCVKMSSGIYFKNIFILYRIETF